MARLKRAVAISSIVRVILRMFLTALRRLTIARAFAMSPLTVDSSGAGPDGLPAVSLSASGSRCRLHSGGFQLLQKIIERFSQVGHRGVVESAGLDNLVTNVGLFALS